MRPIAECWDKTGKSPVSVRWVDTDKASQGLFARSRLVARDFKGGDKDRRYGSGRVDVKARILGLKRELETREV